MAKLVDLTLLAKFKEKQDEANSKKFMATGEYIGSNGLIKSDKIQPGAAEIIPMHVDTTDNITRYYTDNNGVKGKTEINGESGKIYIDIASGGRYIYTYNAADGFISFASEVATTADIDALFAE